MPVASLKDILGTSTAASPQREFYVYNDEHWTPENGGKKCDWMIPVGTQSIKFEIVGGGGPGGSVSHDDYSTGGQGGNTAIKTVNLADGDFTSTDGSQSLYTLCAAGTSQCSCCICCEYEPCRQGCDSFVTGSGLSNFCATGGKGGTHHCDRRCSCYNWFTPGQQVYSCTCLHSCANERTWNRWMCAPGFFGADMGFTGSSGHMQGGYDCNKMYQIGPGEPTGIFSSASPNAGDYCHTMQGCCVAEAMFPGGGGYSAISDTGCCFSGFGAGGLVRVTYS